MSAEVALWDLPEGWAWARFKDVAKVDADLVDPASLPDAVHIAPNHIEGGTGRLLSSGTVASDGVTSAKHRFWPGQIIYSKIRPYLAKAVLVDFPGVCSADCYPISAAIDTPYLHRWLVSPMFTAEAADNQGRTVLPKINQEALAALPVPVAPEAEQRRIVARLDGIQARSRAARDALAEVPALLDQLRQSVLAAAFRGDLTAEWRANNPQVETASALLGRIGRDSREAGTPIDGPALYELPSGWAWAPLERLAEVQLGQRRAPEYVGLREYPYIRAANITWRGLDLSDVKSMGFGPVDGLLLRPGDVLLNEASGSPREVGKPAVWRGEIPNCCFQATVLRLRPASEIVPEWLYFVCLADALLGRYLSLAPGVGILHLTSTRLRQWPVPVPPAAEQAALASVLATKLKTLDDAESALSVLSTDLTTLDQSILARACQGAPELTAVGAAKLIR